MAPREAEQGGRHDSYCRGVLAVRTPDREQHAEYDSIAASIITRPP